MKSYYRVSQGPSAKYAEESHKGGFIGVGWLPVTSLQGESPADLREFNQKFVPVYLEQFPDKTRIGAGLACGQLYTVSFGIKRGDVVLVQDGQGEYFVGEITGDYEYHSEHELTHRRAITWYSDTISRSDMSDSLRNSSGGATTVINLTPYAPELEALLEGKTPSVLTSNDETIEDPSVFALEKHLEDFLVKNWATTILAKDYDIFTEEGLAVGQQYPSDTGPIDILCVHKNGKGLLVVELKKGRASDVVIGQIQRYMGYVQHELAEPGQTVRGLIIALEDDIKIKRALSVCTNIDFYTYKIQFTLEKK
jgi:restriction system protein